MILLSSEGIMATPIDEAKLKQLLKSAIVEVFEERRDLVKEIVEEAIEEIAFARAIDDGLRTQDVTREKVFEILESTR